MSIPCINVNIYIVMKILISMANTAGEKELKTDWDELTASDSTKKVGHKQTLEAEQGTYVPKRYRVGI